MISLDNALNILQSSSVDILFNSSYQNAGFCFLRKANKTVICLCRLFCEEWHKFNTKIVVVNLLNLMVRFGAYLIS